MVRKLVHQGRLSPELEQSDPYDGARLTGELTSPIWATHTCVGDLARHFNRPAAYDAHYSGAGRNGRLPVLDE